MRSLCRPPAPASLARAAPRPFRAGRGGSGRGRRYDRTVRVPGPRGGCTFPAAGEVAGAAPSGPGTPQPPSSRPRAPGAPDSGSGPPIPRGLHTGRPSKSQRQGRVARGTRFLGVLGGRGGGGAERRRPASGQNSKLRWKSSGWSKGEKPGVCGTPRKFRGVNFSDRGIVYPTVLQTERLSLACTVESAGVLVKFRCPGWIHQNPWGSGAGRGSVSFTLLN